MSTTQEIDGVIYPGPAELLEYLEGKLSWSRQFAPPAWLDLDGKFRCCLGHYADMLGVEYQEGATKFNLPDEGIWFPTLPARHWLHNHTVQNKEIQDELSTLNDNDADFVTVIPYLKQLVAGWPTNG